MLKRKPIKNSNIFIFDHFSHMQFPRTLKRAHEKSSTITRLYLFSNFLFGILWNENGFWFWTGHIKEPLNTNRMNDYVVKFAQANKWIHMKIKTIEWEISEWTNPEKSRQWSMNRIYCLQFCFWRVESMHEPKILILFFGRMNRGV